MPIGTSTRPVLTTLPARAKTLVPLLFSVPMPANQSPPLRMIGGDVGEGLDVVDQRRAAPQARLGRVRRARPGRAALALDRGDQRRLLAADERPGADADVDVEVEGRCRRCRRRAARLARPADRRLAAGAMASGYSAADVDVALAGPDRVAGDGHALQHAVRVALQDAAVHERAGVALVGVADRRTCCAPAALATVRPLQAGRVAGAAPAAQAAADDLVDDLGRGHLGQRRLQRLVAAAGEVVVQVLGVDPARSSRSPPGPAGRRTAPAAPGWRRAGRPGALRRGRRGRPGRPARTAGRSREPRPGARRRTAPGSRPA